MSHYQLHPYFGFLIRQITPGFHYKTSKDQFIVGIFGGSVAQRLCDYEFQHHVLAKTFQTLPEFQNKEIVILKFANQAHKTTTTTVDA